MRNYPLYIIFVTALSLLLIFTLLVPKYKELTLLKQEIFLKEADLQSHEEYFERLKGISEQIKANETSFAKIESALPEEISLTDLFNFFQKVASQTELVLTEINPAPTLSEEEERVKVTSVELGLAGGYPGFKNFLSIIEKSARLIEIDRIVFSSEKELFDFKITAKVNSY